MQIELRALQQQLRITALYVTHDQEEALALSDAIAIMHHGRIAQHGTARELYEHPADAFVADFLGSANLLDGVLDHAGGEWMARLEDRLVPVSVGNGFASGQKVSLALRPEQLTLCTGEPPAVRSASPPRSAAWCIWAVTCVSCCAPPVAPLSRPGSPRRRARRRSPPATRSRLPGTARKPSLSRAEAVPRSGRAVLAILLGPVLLFYALVLAAPSLVLWTVGFLQPSQSALFSRIFTLANYARAITDPFYLRILWVTVYVSVETTAACLVLGYPVSFWLAGKPASTRRTLLILLLFPLLLSTVIRVYGWIVLLGRRGVINQLLLETGVVDLPVAFLYHENTVVVGLVSILVPYAIISITNVLTTIDPAIGEAAAVHGAGPWQVFLKVTLPLSRPGIVSASLIVFSIAMSTYLVTLLLGGARIKFVGNLIFDATSSFNWPLGAALSAVLVLTTLLSCYAFTALMAVRR